MAIQTITYSDKQAMGTQPSIPDVNKVTDADMNEIKSVVNNNASEIGAIGEIREYTLNRKTTTLSGGSWQEMVTQVTTDVIPAGTYLILFKGVIGGTTSDTNIISLEPWLDNYGSAYNRTTIPMTQLTSAFQVWRILTPQTDSTHTMTIKGYGSSNFNVSSNILVDWIRLK